MDAVEYIKERNRMCETSDAFRCPLQIDGECKGCDGQRNPAEAVRIVEEWSKAHPIQTNADKFKEVFGMTPVGGPLQCCTEKGFDIVRWNAPYEAPKGD